MKSPSLRLAVTLAAMSCALALSPVFAHDHAAHKAQSDAKPAAGQGVRISLTDTPLIDQDGRTLRLKSEAIGERIVIIGFIYTTCTTVCPPISAIMAQAQDKLGARLGRDVALLTITVDPVRDTPPRLKEYGARLGAGPGWTFLTGAKPQIDEALRAFGAYTPNFADHPPLLLVGDAKVGKWARFFGFASADQLVAAVSDLSTTRGKAGAAQ